MPEFTSPAWLLTAPVLIGLVWWIHRHSSISQRRPVSALFVWRGIDARPLGETKRRRADPAWIRRTLIALLLTAALAGPQLTDEYKRVALVWFDNSRSMNAVEGSAPRWQTALDLLKGELQQAGIESLVLQPLYPHTSHLAPGRPVAAAELESILQRWFADPALQGPLPIPASSPRQHWLVSDFTDPQLQTWAADAAIAKQIGVGRSVGNIALTHLSLRPSLQNPEYSSGSIRISNTGNQAASGHVTVSANGSPLLERQWRLQAGESWHATFDLTLAGETTLVAGIDSTAGGDALAVDNRLALQLSAQPWQTRVLLGPTCTANERLLLRALDTVSIVDRPPADLAVRCSPPASLELPTVYLRAPQQAKTHTGYLIDPDSGLPLLTIDAGPDNDQLADSALLLRLSSAMDRVLGTDLRDQVLQVSNPEADSQLEPLPFAGMAPPTPPGPDETTSRPLLNWLLAPLILLLAYDLWRSLSPRQARSQLRPANGGKS